MDTEKFHALADELKRLQGKLDYLGSEIREFQKDEGETFKLFQQKQAEWRTFINREAGF